MEMATRQSLFLTILDELAQQVQFDLTVMVYGATGDDGLHVFISNEKGQITTKMFPGSLFHSFKIVNGQLFIESALSSTAEITFTDKLIEEQKYRIRSSFIIPFQVKSGENGAFLLGSRTTNLLAAQKILKNYDLSRVISSYSTQAPDEPADQKSEQDEQQIYKSWFELSPVPAMICEKDGTIIQCNSQLEKILDSTLQKYANIYDVISSDQNLNQSYLDQSIGTLQAVTISTKSGHRVSGDLKYARTLDENQLFLQFIESQNIPIQTADEKEWQEKYDFITEVTSSLYSATNIEDLQRLIYHYLDEFIVFDDIIIAISSTTMTNLHFFLYHGNSFDHIVYANPDIFRAFNKLFHQATIDHSFINQLNKITGRSFNKNLKSLISVTLESNENTGAFIVGSALERAYSKYHQDILNGIAYPITCSFLKTIYLERLNQKLQGDFVPVNNFETKQDCNSL